MFFENLASFGQHTALIDGQSRLTYVELAKAISRFQSRLPAWKSLVLIEAENTLDTVVAYLAALNGGHCALLVEQGLAPERRQNLISLYQPNVLVRDDQVTHSHDRQLTLDEDLAVLLSTSGSTGSPKQVALSYGNLDANARSICDYLPIDCTDTTMTTLPFQYSYGLSVINSHLQAGACVMLNRDSVVSRNFWERFRQYGVTSFAGVPFTYEMLLRLRFTSMDLPTLRYCTQAGGKLSADKVRTLASWANETGRQFFVMYGQTEATARMAYNDHALIKPEAIGCAIPGGEFRLRRDDGSDIHSPREEGELHYRGPNVMLGYAESLSDLASFSQISWLSTGDLAWFDEDGDFHVSGRIRRFIKLFGQRIALDDVEQIVAAHGGRAYAVGSDEGLKVALAADGMAGVSEPRVWVANALGLNPSVVQVSMVTELPTHANGKPDYPAVERLFDE